MIILDIHAEQSLSVVDDPIVDHLFGSMALVPAVQAELGETDFVIASPDRGGTTRAGVYAKLLGHGDEFVILSKGRTEPGVVAEGSIKIIGSVKSKTVVFVDDMLDSGGTMMSGAKAVKKAGATSVIAVVTHGLFSGNAMERIQESGIDKVFVTDSVFPSDPENELSTFPKVCRVTVADLLAQAIRRTHDGDSLSALIRAV